MRQNGTFSIVVATLNRGQVVPLTVESLLAQTPSVPYEIIVVDNNSTDDTAARMRAFVDRAAGRVRYLHEREPGVSAARNAGAAAARGAVIAFVDDDVVAHPGWLEALAHAYHSHPEAWCVGGKILLRLPNVLPRWFDPRASLFSDYLSGFDLGDAIVQRHYPDDVWGANFSVRRSTLERVGSFDTRLGRIGPRGFLSEELELCWRIQAAGGVVYYCGGAVVTHVVPEARLTKRYFRGRAYWVGRTWGLLDRKEMLRVRPQELPRVVASGVLNWMRSSRFAGPAQCRTAFQAELRSWLGAGFMHQRLVMAVTRHPGFRPSAFPGLASKADR